MSRRNKNIEKQKKIETPVNPVIHSFSIAVNLYFGNALPYFSLKIAKIKLYTLFLHS